MANMFRALVVMGGGLLGCGGKTTGDSSAVRSTNASDDAGTSGTPAGSSAPAASQEPVSPGTPSPPGTSPVGPIAPDPTGEPPAGPPPIEPDPIVAPANPGPDGAARGPEACPSEQWVCGDFQCSRDRPLNCRNAATTPGDYPECLLVPEQDCTCDESAPRSADDCGTDELLVCLAGVFALTDAAARIAAPTEALPFDCRCVAAPRDGACDVQCGGHDHYTLGFQSHCSQGDLAVLCGDCVYAGILR